MKNLRRSLILLVVSTFVFLVFDPALASWGAGWRTGSVVGSGTVTGLKKARDGGASVLSIAAHFGAKFCTKEDRSAEPNPKSKNKDKDRDGCDEKKNNSSSQTNTAPVLPGGVVVDPGVIPGIVFCKQLGGDDDDHHIVRGIAHASLPIAFNGNAFIPGSAIDSNGNANFQVKDAVDPITLNMMLSAAALCPTHVEDDHHSSGPSYSSYTTPQWTIVDFIPQQFSTSLSASDSMGHVLTKAIYDCSIPWSVLDTLHYKQSEPYTCTVRLNQ